MATLTHGKLTFGVNLGTWLNDAKTYAKIADYNSLGTSAGIRSAFLARHVNRIVEDVLRLNPLLGNARAELSLSSGETRIYDLPSDLHGVDIYTLQFEQTTGLGDAIPVHYVRRDQMRKYLDASTTQILAGAYEASLTDDGVDLEVWPEPPSGMDLIAYYRVKHTALTTSNVDTPDAVSVTELPVDSGDYVALKLAEVLARTDGQREVAASLKDDAAEELVRLRSIIEGAIGTLNKQRTYDMQTILGPYGDYYYGDS